MFGPYEVAVAVEFRYKEVGVELRCQVEGIRTRVKIHREIKITRCIDVARPIHRDILESFNVATLIVGADAAAKAAAVQLLEIRLAMALGGKAFCTMTGDVGSVQAAVAAGRAVIAKAGVLVNAVVISRPHPDVYREVI